MCRSVMIYFFCFFGGPSDLLFVSFCFFSLCLECNALVCALLSSLCFGLPPCGILLFPPAVCLIRVRFTFPFSPHPTSVILLTFPLSHSRSPLHLFSIFFVGHAMHDPRAAVDDAMHDPRPLAARQNAECSLNHWHEEPFFFFSSTTSTITRSSSFTLATLSHPTRFPPHLSFSNIRSFFFDSIFGFLTLLYLFSTLTSPFTFLFFGFKTWILCPRSR